MRKESQILGCTRLRTMFEGISNTILRCCLADGGDVRHTEYDIWDEENRGRNVVLIPREMEVFVHAFDLRVTNIRAVDVRQKI